MEERDSGAPIAAILTALGGAILIIGSVMTWAKASIDLNALADALGVDPSLLSGAGAETSRTFAGTSSSDGKIALVCGIVAILIAIAAYMRRELWKTLGIVAIIAGLVGGGLALYDISTKGDIVSEAKSAAAPSLAAVGIDTSILDDVFKVSLGIGIWLCVAGGIAVLVGGILLVARRSAPAMAGMGSGSAYVPADSGFGTPTAPGTTVTPSPAAGPPPPPPPAPAPSPPEEGAGTSVPDGGGGTPPPA